MKMQDPAVETLTFWNRSRNEEATVVTDGRTYHSYTMKGRQQHRSLTAAIGYLEARGYSIEIQ